MARLKIKDAPLLTNVIGTEKIPTGSRGDFAITPDMLTQYFINKLPFVTQSQLASAREKAAKENLKIDFQKHDARDLPFDKEFDFAIMLCEGGFPLMETDEMNFEILKSVTKSLKEKSKFISSD